MRIILALAVALFLMAFEGKGEVLVTNIALSRFGYPFGTNTYSVPSGKSLYIEHIFLSSTNANVYYIKQVALSMTVCVVAEDQTMTSFHPAIKLNSGITLWVSTNFAIIYGLLVDNADVYAAVPSEFKSTQYAVDGGIEGTIGLSSPRPSIVKMEISADMQNWQKDPDNVSVTRSSEPGQWNYTATGSNDVAFFRARARGRRPQ